MQLVLIGQTMQLTGRGNGRLAPPPQSLTCFSIKPFLLRTIGKQDLGASFHLPAFEVCGSKVLCELESLANDQLNGHDRHRGYVYKIKSTERNRFSLRRKKTMRTH